MMNGERWGRSGVVTKDCRLTRVFVKRERGGEAGSRVFGVLVQLYP